MSSLVERLRAPKSSQIFINRDGTVRHQLLNPDGPEAANVLNRIADKVSECRAGDLSADEAVEEIEAIVREALSLHKGGRDGD